jgi:hypothetical protein
MDSTITRSLSALALSVVVLAGASACAIPEPTPTNGASGSPSISPSTTPTPEPELDGLPVIRSCDELVSDRTIFDYNQNFVAEDAFTPATGSKAAEAVTLGGLVCGWVNQTSGETITVAVTNPKAEKLQSLKDSAASAKPAITFDGYFTAGEDDAQAQAFTGLYWVVVETDFAMGDSEIEPFVTSAVTSLNN